MRPVVVQGYTFEELSSSTKDNVRAMFSEDWDPEFELDYYKSQLEEYGYTDAEISFSGFYSQGDGASFTGNVYLPTWIRNVDNTQPYHRLLSLIEEGWIEDTLDIVRHDKFHSHHMTMSIHASEWLDLDKYPRIEKLWNALLGDVLEHARKQARLIFSELRDDYEGYISDESISEMAQDMDLIFDGQGRILTTVG